MPQNFSSKRELVSPLLEIEVGLLQKPANSSFNRKNVFT